MPYGITSAPEIYQPLAANVLSGLNGVRYMMDDVFIFAETQQKHDLILHDVLRRQ